MSADHLGWASGLVVDSASMSTRRIPLFTGYTCNLVGASVLRWLKSISRYAVLVLVKLCAIAFRYEIVI